MENPKIPMKKLPSGSFRNRELLVSLTSRLERISEDRDTGYLVRLASGAREMKELIRRYSNDSML